MELKIIHREISFHEEAWLKPYFDPNAQLRTNAANNFEKIVSSLWIIPYLAGQWKTYAIVVTSDLLQMKSLRKIGCKTKFRAFD